MDKNAINSAGVNPVHASQYYNCQAYPQQASYQNQYSHYQQQYQPQETAQYQQVPQQYQNQPYPAHQNSHYSQPSQQFQPSYQQQTGMNRTNSVNNSRQDVGQSNQGQRNYQRQPQQNRTQNTPNSQYSQPRQQQQPRQQGYPPQHQRDYHRQPTQGNPSYQQGGNSNNNQSSGGDYKDFKEATINCCRDYMGGHCNKGEDRCKFAHPPPYVDVKNNRVVVCFDFTRNRCRRDQPPCRYMHPPRHLLPNFRNNAEQSAPMNGIRDNCYDRGNNSNGCKINQWGPAPTRDENGRSAGGMAGSSRQNYGKHGEGNRPTQIGVCVAFLKNNCTRQECKYAHPPSNIRIYNGKVNYCIDFTRGNCIKTDCKYFHMPEYLATMYGKIDNRGQKRTHEEMKGGAMNNGSRSPRYSKPDDDQDTKVKSDIPVSGNHLTDEKEQIQEEQTNQESEEILESEDCEVELDELNDDDYQSSNYEDVENTGNTNEDTENHFESNEDEEEPPFKRSKPADEE